MSRLDQLKARNPAAAASYLRSLAPNPGTQRRRAAPRRATPKSLAWKPSVASPAHARLRCSPATAGRRQLPRHAAAASAAAAATPPPTAALLVPASLKEVLGSACVAAAAVLLFSLLTRGGRARWAELLSGWRDALPANPALRRALAWLPLVAVAKALEALFGLQLLNLVYVAFAASSILQGITQTAASPPPVPWAGAAGTAGSEAAPPPQQQHPAAAAQQAARMGGINSLALSLFAQRFPKLAAQPVLATSPAVLTVAAGAATQGQLYVTASHVAFHGTFGRGARVVPLADVSVAAAQPAAAQLSVLLLSTPEGELRLTAVNAMGGAESLAALSACWQAARHGGAAGGEA